MTSFRGYLFCAAPVKLSEKNESAREIFLCNWLFLMGNFLFFYLSTVYIHSMSELLYLTYIHLKHALIFSYFVFICFTFYTFTFNHSSKVVYNCMLWQVCNYNGALIISLYLRLLQSHQNWLMASEELPKMSKMNQNDRARHSLKYAVCMQSSKLISKISTWRKGTDYSDWNFH